MKKILTVCLLSVALFSYGQTANDEIAVFVSLPKLEEGTSFQFLYRRELKKPEWSLRGGLRLEAATSKIIRPDTVYSSGKVIYDVSMGVQKRLPISGLTKIYLYTAADAYLNSEFSKRKIESFYGYYWNVGFMPIIGLSYEPFQNIRLSLEGRSDINLNFQQYSADGNNKDVKISIAPMNQLAIGLGYLF